MGQDKALSDIRLLPFLLTICLLNKLQDTKDVDYKIVYTFKIKIPTLYSWEIMIFYHKMYAIMGAWYDSHKYLVLF